MINYDFVFAFLFFFVTFAVFCFYFKGTRHLDDWEDFGGLLMLSFVIGVTGLFWFIFIWIYSAIILCGIFYYYYIIREQDK